MKKNIILSSVSFIFVVGLSFLMPYINLQKIEDGYKLVLLLWILLFVLGIMCVFIWNIFLIFDKKILK